MHTAGVARALAVLLLAACSSDRLTNIDKTPSAPVREISQGGLLLNHSGSPATDLTVAAINDSGIVAGSLTDGSPQVATTWAPPNYNPTTLPLPGDTGTSLGTRISNDGTVLGKICDGAGQQCRWVTWKNGTITPITPEGDARDICPCDGQVIVGGLTVDGVQHPVVWTHGKLLDVGVPSGFASAEFIAVDEGFMAGTAVATDGRVVPFRWSPQFGFQMLPTFGNAIDVNSSGTVLVDDNHVYPLGGSPIAIPSDLARGALSMATALNDSGVVAGIFMFQGDDALPPPSAGEWKIGTDFARPRGPEGSQALDINNAGFEIGVGFVGPGGTIETEGWVF